jgi:hypothetical protein
MVRARETLFRTGAGYGFYRAGDDNRAFAQAIKPTPGYVTIDVHGSIRGFTIDDGRLTPGQFASALRELIASGHLVIPPGEGIRLIACDTADGGATSPAADLADQLGVEVLAPDRVVWTAIDGEEIVASPRLVEGVYLPIDPPDGRWHRFSPGATPEQR